MIAPVILRPYVPETSTHLIRALVRAAAISIFDLRANIRASREPYGGSLACCHFHNCEGAGDQQLPDIFWLISFIRPRRSLPPL
jgi:hypothetical protein